MINIHLQDLLSNIPNAKSEFLEIKKGNLSCKFIVFEVFTYHNDDNLCIKIKSNKFPHLFFEKDFKPVTLIYEECEITLYDYRLDYEISISGMEKITFQVLKSDRSY